MTIRWLGLLMLVPLLGACATVPTGPSVMVLPGGGKSFEQFQADDGMCRQWAYQQTGITPGEAANQSGITSAAIGTVLGAAAGAAIGAAAGNPALGAAAGAGGGLLFGSAGGLGAAQYSGYAVQQRYDIAYQQCMYARGNQIPGVVRNAYRGGPATTPIPPPPPPPPASSPTNLTYPPPPPPPSR
jgi:OmpA family protein